MKKESLLCQFLRELRRTLVWAGILSVLFGGNIADADNLNPVLDWWNQRVPQTLQVTTTDASLTIDREVKGFFGTNAVTTEVGQAQVVRIQYGQVHLKVAKDPLFLLVGGRDMVIRVVVKSSVSGLRAPTLRLVLDHMEQGRKLNIVLPAQGALTSEDEPEKPDFFKTPFRRAYIVVVPGNQLVPGRYRLWVGGGSPGSAYIKPHEEQIEVKPFYTLPVTVMPFQWRDGVAPDMRQHTQELYRTAFERYFPFIQPVVRIRPFAVISAMSEADFDESQFHLDGTTMMIADRARRGLYVGVYHKNKHAQLGESERVGTSSGSLLVVQDQLGEDELDVLAHEIGHSLGLKHSPCGNPEAPIDTHFPYAEAGMGSSWGLDWNSQRGKIVLIDPRETKDLMSYCFDHRFVSDYNYSYANNTWIRYRAQNHLALMGDIFALQIFAYPPAHQLEVHGIGDLIDAVDGDSQQSAYVFEATDLQTGHHARIPAFTKVLPSGEQAFIARVSAVGWLNMGHITLLDPSGQIVMDGEPSLSYLNQEAQSQVKWTFQSPWLTVSFDPHLYDRGIVVYEAANGVVATLAFLNQRGQQHVSLQGLPSGGAFWTVLASVQRDPYGRRKLVTVKQPWSNIMVSSEPQPAAARVPVAHY